MPYVLPQPSARQTGWDQAGFAAGVGVDLLLKALLAGKLGMPTPSQQAPPGMQGPVTQSGQFYPQSQVRPPIRIGPFEVKPDLQRQLDMQKLQNAPLERQKLEADIANQQALSGAYNRSGTGVNLQEIEDAALAGDEDAIAAYRYFKKRGQL